MTVRCDEAPAVAKDSHQVEVQFVRQLPHRLVFVVDEIGAVATGSGGPFDKDVPLKPVIIERMEELK